MKKQNRSLLRILPALAATLLLSQAAHAAPATWNATPADATWANGANWTPAAAPGANDGSFLSIDKATFSNTVTNGNGTAASPVVIDLNRNIQSIDFSTATASPYVIGTTGGNALLLTSGGTIQTVSGIANIETVNAPLVLEPATTASAITYSFSSNAASATNVLNFGGAITTGVTSSTATLTLTGTNTGTNKITGTLSDTGSGGLFLSKTSSGSWAFAGNGTSTLAKAQLNISAGTFNFGIAGTDAPSLTINAFPTGAGNFGVIVGGTANVNIVNGTISLAAATQQGFVLNGTNNTYTQTGGTYTTGGIIEFANASAAAISTVNISAGATTITGGSRLELAVRGISTTTLSGTGILTAAQVVMSTTQIGSGSATSTLNLGNFSTSATTGGTLVTGSIIKGTGGSTGTQTFNFDGGTLKASASSATFMTGLTNAFVKSGGAVIDTQTNNITIGQALLTDATSTGGGLTKLGGTTAANGILTLSNANSYTGPTTVSGGNLTAAANQAFGALTSTANVTVNGGTMTINSGVTDAIPDGSVLLLTSSGTAVLTLSGPVSGTPQETVNGLVLNGSPAAAGTYGNTGSGATNILPGFFAGTGQLNVSTTTTVPEPSTYAMIVCGLGILVVFQRSRRSAR